MATQRRLGPRFGPEAGLILAAAAFAALLELPWPGVVAVVLCAWLAVAIFEIVRAHVGPFSPEEERKSAQPEPEPQLEPERARDTDLHPETVQQEQEPASLVAAAPGRDVEPRPESHDLERASAEQEQRS
jgi:hypothetical protein